jgi:hypothetical protein
MEKQKQASATRLKAAQTYGRAQRSVVESHESLPLLWLIADRASLAWTPWRRLPLLWVSNCNGLSHAENGIWQPFSLFSSSSLHHLWPTVCPPPLLHGSLRGQFGENALLRLTTPKFLTLCIFIACRCYSSEGKASLVEVLQFCRKRYPGSHKRRNTTKS